MDVTESMASHFRVKLVHIKPKEFTFGCSLNMGITVATRELVTIASTPVYPAYPDWLERLLDPFDDPRVTVSYGKQLGGETSSFSGQQLFVHWYPDHSNLAQGYPFCNNTHTAIRCPAREKNPYYEILTGLKDQAWARGALDGGYTIASVAEAEIVPIYSEIRHRVANRYRREAMAFKVPYPQAY